MIHLQQTHWQQIVAHAEKISPNECCGLVSGKGQTSVAIHPIDNILESPTRFEMHPTQQIKAMLAIEKEGLDLLAIYHSHPHGPDQLSSIDIAEAGYPNAVQLLVTMNNGIWTIKGFLIDGDEIKSVEI